MVAEQPLKPVEALEDTVLDTVAAVEVGNRVVHTDEHQVPEAKPCSKLTANSVDCLRLL